ncbi:MAG: TetR/AcrR family transcriptional regulator [Treponema sp.]|jgi:AcrR family transcriptional regulator|nr:TetR/AcrR family transcriptional regulator [Treponema sp.]
MTKAEIIRAAFKVWGRSFYQNTSLSQLARELGVSKPALYRHFLSKQLLMDAMTAYFFDDFAGFIRADFARAAQNKDRTEGIFIMLRVVTRYYAQNEETFIFSLMKVYDWNTDQYTTPEWLKRRSVDMDVFQHIIKTEYTAESLLLRLMFATLIFFVAHFHKIGKACANSSGEEGIQKIIALVSEIIAGGLGYTRVEVDGLRYGELESRVMETVQNVEDEPLLKAVAEAVAEAGPWKASMDMVARRSGLSKSSLYGHFKNKRAMLRQLFITEFKRIIAFARQGISLSAAPDEQLYLGVFSIAVYLRSRPEILVALDWMRTLRLDLDKAEKEQSNFFSLFEDIDIGTLPDGEEPGYGGEKQELFHWILFLLIGILMWRSGGRALGDVRNSDIRDLYRFLTMGLNGFKKF